MCVEILIVYSCSATIDVGNDNVAGAVPHEGVAEIKREPIIRVGVDKGCAGFRIDIGEGGRVEPVLFVGEDCFVGVSHIDSEQTSEGGFSVIL